MDKRDRRYTRRDEWEDRKGVWDEDEDLIDKPPLPERLGQRVRRASREIGHEVSDEMERLGGRLRSWSQDAGRHAERLTDDLGGGLERVARTGRRWIQDGDEDEYSLEDDEIEYRRKKNKKLGKKAAKEMHKQKKRLDELDEQITRPNTRPTGTKPYVEEERNKARRSRGWGSWFGRKSDETESPEGRRRAGDTTRLQSDIDLVCVDASISSEHAFRYALRNIPRSHTLLLVHGVFTPPGAVDSKLEDEREMARVKDKFRSLCQRNGRRCVFREFEYTTNNELGENVCAIAERQNVGSVILGKRANASDLRRALLGSPSLSVMQQCNAPVTLIAERKENDFE